MRKSHIFLMALLIAALMMVLPGTYAQDGNDLSDDEQALLERLLTITENDVTYDSYVSSYREVNTQNQSVNTGGDSPAQTFNQQITLEAEREISRGDDAYGRATVSATVEQGNANNQIAFGIEGDVRFVDDTLYASIVPTEGADSQGAPPFLSELNGEWERVQDPQSTTAYQLLSLQSFREAFNVEGGDAETSTRETLQTVEELANFASSLTQTTVEIEGETYDEININFAGQGMVAYLESTGGLAQDQSSQVLRDALSAIEDEVLTIGLVVDGEDAVIGRRVNANIDIELDGAEVNPNAPEGSTISLGIGIEQSETLTNINGDIDPVEAPDVPAPEMTPEATPEMTEETGS